MFNYRRGLVQEVDTAAARIEHCSDLLSRRARMRKVANLSAARRALHEKLTLLDGKLAAAESLHEARLRAPVPIGRVVSDTR